MFIFTEDVRITKQPVATPVMIGQKLRLECRAAGVPRPQYMWFQGQKPLGNQKSSVLEIDKVCILIVGAIGNCSKIGVVLMSFDV